MRMLILANLLACSQDQEVAKRTDVQGANDWPKAVLDPPRLEFGEMSYLESAEQTIGIINDGTDNSILKIDEIVPTSGLDVGYTMTALDCPEGTECSIELLHGERTDVAVTLQSLGPGEALGELLVRSNDESNPVLTAPMHGLGVMPFLEVDPPEVGFPDTTVGCTQEQDFTLTNVGTDDLVINEIVQDGPGYEVLERPPELPLTLASGESAKVTVGFAPTGGDAFPGSLRVMSNDPRGEQDAPLAGIGVVPGTQHVVHTVEELNKLDLLVVVDRSGSMDDDQAALAANAADFAAALMGMGKDVQVMVVTGKDGCGTGIMKPGDVDFVTKFQTGVGDGLENVWSEAGLYVSQQAIEQTGEYMCNAGFLRDDALLHVIYISDEPDRSPVTWYDVVQGMREAKGASHLLKMSAVIGPVPGGCSTTSNTAEPGKGYHDAVLATYGLEVSLCDDWAPQLNVVATQQITRDTFGMLGRPEPDTITVMVDGLARPSGWHYMSDSNSIVFDTDLPYSGQTVDITYEIPLTCG